jgi:hypothetical protein
VEERRKELEDLYKQNMNRSSHTNKKTFLLENELNEREEIPLALETSMQSVNTDIELSTTESFNETKKRKKKTPKKDQEDELDKIVKKKKKREAEDLDTAEDLSSRRTISYWSVAERNAFVKALAKHGRNWSAIASEIGTKSAIQARNYFTNFRVKLDFDRILEENGKVNDEEKIEDTEPKKGPSIYPGHYPATIPLRITLPGEKTRKSNIDMLLNEDKSASLNTSTTSTVNTTNLVTSVSNSLPSHHPGVTLSPTWPMPGPMMYYPEYPPAYMVNPYLYSVPPNSYPFVVSSMTTYPQESITTKEPHTFVETEHSVEENSIKQEESARPVTRPSVTNLISHTSSTENINSEKNQ